MTRALKPPFVLVHGAFHGGWCWQSLARVLRAAGHEVFTPTQTGLGERRHLLTRDITMETFILDILNLLICEDLQDVILVGHSFGGRTISGVADRAPERVQRLIFIDGGIPLGGLSKLAAMRPDAMAARIQASKAYDGGLSVPPPPAGQFGISDPKQAAWLDGRLTGQPLGAEASPTPLDHAVGNSCAVTYIHCVAPVFAGTAASAAFARQQEGWRFLEFEGGHEAIIFQPDEIAHILFKQV